MFPYNVQFIAIKKITIIIKLKETDFINSTCLTPLLLRVKIIQWSVDAIFPSKLPQIGNNINSRDPFTSYVIYLKTAKQQGQACLITEQWFTELFQY